MTMQPLIGITTYGRTEHPAPSTHYETHFAVPTEYVDAVRRAGGVAVLLPPGEAEWSRWLDMCDGVILSGGADVEPRHYGGNAEHPRVEKPDEERDVLELAMTQKLLNQQIPTLFICRGMQVLNIALGGTLHEHVPDVLADDMHRDENGMWAFHEVIAEAGTRVAKAMGCRRVSDMLRPSSRPQPSSARPDCQCCCPRRSCRGGGSGRSSVHDRCAVAPRDERPDRSHPAVVVR